MGETNLILLRFVKLIMEDFAIKVSLAEAVGSSIWPDTANNTGAQLIKDGHTVLSATGKRFLRIYKRITEVDP